MEPVKQLELNLWAILREAHDTPEDATFPVIWQALDGALPGLGVVEQLKIAGATIAQVTDIFQIQAGLMFELLEATASADGPSMAEGAFDRYVRQSMAIDLEQYVAEFKSLPRLPRMVKETEEAFYSESESVEKEALLEVLHDEIVLTEAQIHAEAMSVAHDEDVSDWVEMIRVQLVALEGAIELQALVKLLGLPFIELWLGLLLGGYGLERVDDSDEAFYQVAGIWVALVD
jgi:hypothetical protein